MSDEWAERVRKRNRSFLITHGLMLIGYLAIFGLHLSDAFFIASLLWVIYVVAIHLRWKADPKGGGVAVRKELLRQGTLIKHAWAWAMIPYLLGVGLGPWWLMALLALVAVRFSISFWRHGEALIRQAND